MNRTVLSFFQPVLRLRGWHRNVLAVACATTVAVPAWAASSAITTLGPISIELIDLRPGDGIAPSLKFNVDGDEAGIAAVAAESWPPEVFLHARYGSWQQGDAIAGQTRHASAAAMVNGGAAASPAGTQTLLQGTAVDFMGAHDVSAQYGAMLALNQGTNPSLELSPWTALVFSFDVTTELQTRHANDSAFTAVGLSIDNGSGLELRDEFTLECLGACFKQASRSFGLTFSNESDALLMANWSVWGNVTGTGFASAVPEAPTLGLLLAGLGMLGARLRSAAARTPA